eukprot:jgi/Tetstr1/442135/TSEL_030289.t1
MAELRKLWYMLDSNGVHIRARYIRSAANVWADRLSTNPLDGDNWQLDPVLFAELEQCGVRHSVDRFASAPETRCYHANNAVVVDPGCEAVDSLHLCRCRSGDREEQTDCTPLGRFWPDLV